MIARPYRPHAMATALGLAALTAACAAGVPTQDPGTRVVAGLVELAVVGDSAAAEAYLLQHLDAGAEGVQLTVDLRNLLWQIRRRGTVRPESIYRVGEEVFALLVNDEGLRFQFSVEMTADAAITAFRHFSGWRSPADPPIVLGSMVLGDRHWLGIPPDLAGLDRALGLYVAGETSRLDMAHVMWDVTDSDMRPWLRMVTTPPSATLLLVGVPDLTPGPVVTIAQDVELGTDQRVAPFDLADRRYRVELSFEDPEQCDAVVTLIADRQPQVLYRIEDLCDGPHFRIEWAGDLNGDGRLDLVANLSPKYSVFPAELWLSTDDEDTELVQSVARYVHVGL